MDRNKNVKTYSLIEIIKFKHIFYVEGDNIVSENKDKTKNLTFCKKLHYFNKVQFCLERNDILCHQKVFLMILLRC